LKTTSINSRRRNSSAPPPNLTDRDLAHELRQRLVGQQAAIDAIVPYVTMYQAGLAPEGRPAGVFLLLGPSGTGKTRTVEALAEVLHGSEKAALKIDCGEYQMDHEVAKLIGAPPGYLGHRETQPLLTQFRLSSVASEQSPLSIVLFDEVEKAAPSLNRLLLGVLDKGQLRLGDNTTVSFENSIIFMTSNLGAAAMMKELGAGFGFDRTPNESAAGVADRSRKLAAIAANAVRKSFTPEFINRLDSTVTYEPLSKEALEQILDLQIARLDAHIRNRLGLRAFNVEIRPEARAYLLEQGVSLNFGARELKRTIHRQVLQPLSSFILAGRIRPGSFVRISLSEAGDSLSFTQRLYDPAA
jgi:ATP-dependent Clp protease ATP-binding subunit ClpA